MTATTWCPSCESTVRTDDVHSCYDAARVRAHRAAELAVVDAAKTYEALDRHAALAKPGDFVRALAGVRETVRALRDLEAA